MTFRQTRFPLNIFVRRKSGTKSNRRGNPIVALSRWLTKPENWLSERLKISTSTNLLILPEIEMERLLNSQKWDTKYLLTIFNKKYS